MEFSMRSEVTWPFSDSLNVRYFPLRVKRDVPAVFLSSKAALLNAARERNATTFPRISPLNVRIRIKSDLHPFPSITGVLYLPFPPRSTLKLMWFLSYFLNEHNLGYWTAPTLMPVGLLNTSWGCSHLFYDIRRHPSVGLISRNKIWLTLK